MSLRTLNTPSALVLRFLNHPDGGSKTAISFHAPFSKRAYEAEEKPTKFEFWVKRPWLIINV